MDADGSNQTTVPSGLNASDRPTWSPDGQFLAFRGYVDGAGGSRIGAEVFRVRTDGSDLTNITNTRRTQEREPDWNPNWTNDLVSAIATASNVVAASTSDIPTDTALPEGETYIRTVFWTSDGKTFVSGNHLGKTGDFRRAMQKTSSPPVVLRVVGARRDAGPADPTASPHEVSPASTGTSEADLVDLAMDDVDPTSLLDNALLRDLALTSIKD